ncbi:MAG: Long-chain-alcohol dehydrogenase 1 [Bacteroidia bacterium]|nr:Long-chain-alcohol dehydrogenase 1 [Bacteroidia bacterium]
MLTAHFPNRILFGIGIINRIKEELLLLDGCKSILLITSPGMPSRIFFPEILKTIQSVVKNVQVIATLTPEPDDKMIEMIFGQIELKNVDAVIGVGGGSVMDAAKLISCRVVNNEPFVEMAGSNLVKRKGPPILLIPTVAGSGSEVTHEAVLTDNDSGTRYALKDFKLLSHCSIIDPSLLTTCPKVLIATSGIDAFIHAVESIGNLNANVFSNLNGLQAIKSLKEGLVEAICDVTNERALNQISLGSMFAGFAFAATGTAAIHACGYPLTTIHKIPHGQANAVMLPYVIKYNLQTGNYYDSITELWGTKNLPLSLLQLVNEIGLKTNLKSMGIKIDELEKLAEIAFLDKRHLSVNPTDISLDILKNIFKNAWEGNLD